MCTRSPQIRRSTRPCARYKFIVLYCMALRPRRDRDLEARGRDRGVDNSSRGETETKAFRARDRDEAEAYQHRGETEPRHYCASRRPRDRGVKTEATSHIHIIPRTDIVLKRSAGSYRTEAEPEWHIQEFERAHPERGR